jgi:molybdopterin-synthase adenylyltransferase
MTAELDRLLQDHAAGDPAQEDAVFVLWSQSTGAARRNVLLRDPIWPRGTDRRLHGNVEIEPHYFERALAAARAADSGLALIHGHSRGSGWQDASHDDAGTEDAFAPAVRAATRRPFIGLTVAGDGAWSGRVYERTRPGLSRCDPVSTVRSVGDRLRLSWHPELEPRPRFREDLNRTVSAWGADVQADLMRLRVGVVGCGSVGDIVAEGLARVGVRRISLIDFDYVKPHNLDRLLHARRRDARRRRRKVDVTATALRASATADDFEVRRLPFSVIEPEGFQAALDCDLLFCCVDRPWARQVLNGLAFTNLIPVIDGGILVETRSDGRLRGAHWRAHVVVPGRACLRCLGQFDPADVTLEMAGLLDDPRYIEGLPPSHRLRRNENVFPFSLATAGAEMLQTLALIVTGRDIGQHDYDFVTGGLARKWAGCRDECPYPAMTARGDDVPELQPQRHVRAEESRRESAGWWRRLVR